MSRPYSVLRARRRHSSSYRGDLRVVRLPSVHGAKGIGELGGVGAWPAIANAVFHATGVRVRELPVRPEMLLANGHPADDRC